mgnify:CR=1 FL=1|jgi:hypothetical protein
MININFVTSFSIIVRMIEMRSIECGFITINNQKSLKNERFKKK